MNYEQKCERCGMDMILHTKFCSKSCAKIKLRELQKEYLDTVRWLEINK